MPILKRAWHLLPGSVRAKVFHATSWTGVPYLLSFLTSYGSTQSAANFAANLLELKDAYRRSSGSAREQLATRINRLANALVLPNGVRRTTYPNRHDQTLRSIFDDEGCRLDRADIRVLDIPSANGVSSLGSYEVLSQRYRLTRYVLADLLTRTLYDRDRDCIFDEAGNLLQVRRGNRFFSIYRAHHSGEPFGRVARAVLSPLEIVSRRLKRQYPFDPQGCLTPILMVHPDVEEKIGEGILELKTMDAFGEIEGDYEIILSFNLLQKNYFPPAVVARGTENLGRALVEGGLLVLGSPDAGGVSPYRVLRKCGGRLTEVKSHGDF